MDKLEPAAREAIKKMNTDKLRMKLAKVGVDEEEIAAMSREQLMHAWAERVAEGREEPLPTATASIKAQGYDIDFERQRLEFEMKKFEDEMSWRRQEKEEKLAREKIEKEEKLAREESEKADRLISYQLREKELRVQQEMLEQQKTRDKWEREKQKTPAAQAKFYGDVLKNVMPKFPSDVADTPVLFESVEKLFSSFSVPTGLQSKLLLPYLNDKAKSLLLRLDKSKQDDYEEVKKFLLRELKLTPVQFKNRFDHATRNNDETYMMFCARLKNLLTYYCQSRSIGNSFENFFSLCVADRIKSTLSEACLDHVLTAEGNDWLKCDNLAERVDIYLANHTHEGRPKHFKNAGITNPGKANFSTPEAQSSRRWNAGNGNSRNGSGNANANGRTVPENNVAKSASNTNGGNKNKGLCYICQSPDHRQFNCPLRSGQALSGGQSSASARAPMARNFACAVETRDTVTGPDKGEGTPRALTETAVVAHDDPINRDEPVEATSSSQVRAAAMHRQTTGGTVET